MSAQSVAINLLAQLIPGFLMANRPVPNMVSLTFVAHFHTG
jgi:hypothetical protein